MSRRAWLRLLLWSVTALAVGLEVWGAAADTGATWTESLVSWLPVEVTTALVGVLVGWLPGHFEDFYAAKGPRTMGVYAKAITGGLTAGLTALGVALADGVVTSSEWVGVAVAALGALGVVWAVPNKQPQ